MSTIKIKGAEKRRTAKAILLSVDMICPDPIGYGVVEFESDVWLPLSQITRTEDGRWEIPLWLAKQRGLRHTGFWSKTAIITEAA